MFTWRHFHPTHAMYVYSDSIRIAYMHTLDYIFIDSSISDQQFELFNDNRMNEWMKKEKNGIARAAFLKVVNINNYWAQKPKFNTQKFEEIFHKINNFRFFSYGKKGQHICICWFIVKIAENIQMFCRIDPLKWHVKKSKCDHLQLRIETMDLVRCVCTHFCEKM